MYCQRWARSRSGLTKKQFLYIFTLLPNLGTSLLKSSFLTLLKKKKPNNKTHPQIHTTEHGESQGSGAEDEGAVKFLAKVRSKLETFTPGHETVQSISWSPRANKDIKEKNIYIYQKFKH